MDPYANQPNPNAPYPYGAQPNGNQQSTFMAAPINYAPQPMYYQQPYPYPMMPQQPGYGFPPPPMPMSGMPPPNYGYPMALPVVQAPPLQNTITNTVPAPRPTTSVTTGSVPLTVPTIAPLTVSAPITTQINGSNQKALPLFISCIPDGVKDEDIEKILKCFGDLAKWKRLVSPKTGKLQKFGFAEFYGPKPIITALRILGDIDRPIYLPSPIPATEDAPHKALLVKVDDEVQKFINLYKRTHSVAKLESESNDVEVFNKIESIIKSMPGHPETENADASGADANKKSSKDRHFKDSRDADSESSDDDKAVRRFIDSEEHKARHRADDYYDRLKAWEDREIYRSKAFKRNQQRDNETEMLRAKDREVHAARFKEWDDDKEREAGIEDYYTDRARWWEKRQLIRQHEIDADEADKQREREMIEHEKRMAELKVKEEAERKSRMEREAAEKAKQAELAALAVLEDARSDKDSKLDGDEGTPASNSGVFPEPDNRNTPTLSNKLLLNVGINSNKSSPSMVMLRRPRTITLNTDHGFVGNDDDETDIANRPRRQLIRLEYSDGEDENSSKRSRNSEKGKKQKIKDLMDSIPSAKADLFKWEIKWEYLDEVESLASKKIKEYLGQAEPELTKFVIDHLRKKQSPSLLVDEMEKVLDEESTTFVLLLWRMIVYETEAKHLKLI